MVNDGATAAAEVRVRARGAAAGGVGAPAGPLDTAGCFCEECMQNQMQGK